MCDRFSSRSPLDLPHRIGLGETNTDILLWLIPLHSLSLHVVLALGDCRVSMVLRSCRVNCLELLVHQVLILRVVVAFRHWNSWSSQKSRHHLCLLFTNIRLRKSRGLLARFWHVAYLLPHRVVLHFSWAELFLNGHYPKLRYLKVITQMLVGFRLINDRRFLIRVTSDLLQCF